MEFNLERTLIQDTISRLAGEEWEVGLPTHIMK